MSRSVVLRPALIAAPLVLGFAGILFAPACDRNTQSNGGDDAGTSGEDMAVVPSLDAACATGGAKAALKRLNLVVIFDRSGSMGDNTPPINIDPATKWIPVGNGLKAFFEDPESVGVNASLQYFPYKQNPLEECNASAYFNPDVPLTALPSATFATNIDATSPKGGTPTLPAVEGAIEAAKKIAKDDPAAKIAIILVTDGEPESCGSSVQNVSGAVSAVSATIPTYVIGLGDLTALSAISMAGGTGAPVLVTVGDPTQTRTAILDALRAIRGQQLPCEFDLPSPPAGMVLELDKVNVLYTPSVGMQSALTYDKDCVTGEGWHYDDVNAPKKVILCAQTCSVAQQDKGAGVDILFGCQTLGDVL